MSYDLRIGVKVEGADGLIAVIAEPELSDPTYNIGKMLRTAMDWDFHQSTWYRVSDVFPRIECGIRELRNNPQKYKKYEPRNGWGNTESALNALLSLRDCIKENAEGIVTWQAIPLECMYVAW